MNFSRVAFTIMINDSVPSRLPKIFLNVSAELKNTSTQFCYNFDEKHLEIFYLTKK